MRYLLLLLVALLAAPAEAQSLNDQYVLGNSTAFQSRIREAVIAAAIAISSDGLTTGINLKRHAQAQAIMNGPDSWKEPFATALATQAAVNGPATASGTVTLTPMICPQPPGTCVETGNVTTQQALVTDTVINTNVAAVYNAFFGGQ